VLFVLDTFAVAERDTKERPCTVSIGCLAAVGAALSAVHDRVLCSAATV
jgi:hypothetical protein